MCRFLASHGLFGYKEVNVSDCLARFTRARKIYCCPTSSSSLSTRSSPNHTTLDYVWYAAVLSSFPKWRFLPFLTTRKIRNLFVTTSHPLPIPLGSPTSQWRWLWRGLLHIPGLGSCSRHLYLDHSSLEQYQSLAPRFQDGIEPDLRSRASHHRRQSE